MKRATYVGPEWQNPYNQRCHYTYGLTGFYTAAGNFIPDDNGIPPVAVDKKYIYFGKYH
jgi:hypothetical protein